MAFKPFAFRRSLKFVAMFGGQRFSNRNQVITRIKPCGNLANIFAKRFAVAKMCRAGQRIDLAAGIIDVILGGDGKAR